MNIEDIKKPENIVYKKTPILTDNVMHYCPGCSHGTVHKLIAEVIEEMGIQEETIAISPVGCSVFAYNYLNVDWQQAAHGRAPALATATKRLNPEKYVFTYQGDGDLASIGTAEIIHACVDVIPCVLHHIFVMCNPVTQYAFCTIAINCMLESFFGHNNTVPRIIWKFSRFCPRQEICASGRWVVCTGHKIGMLFYCISYHNRHIIPQYLISQIILCACLDFLHIVIYSSKKS